MRKIDMKQCRYIAGGLFAAELVLTLIGAITGSFSFWTVLSLAATVLMAAAMFSEKYVLLAAGAGLKLPSGLYSVVMNLIWMFDVIDSGYFGRYNSYSLFYALSNILSLASCILLLIAVFKRRTARKLCFASAGLRAGVLVMTIVSYVIFGATAGAILRICCRLILSTLFACGSIVLSGIVMHTGEKRVIIQPAAPVAASVMDDTATRIDKLMKLKALLDNGILTQEEFNAKKQELLNM